MTEQRLSKIKEVRPKLTVNKERGKTNGFAKIDLKIASTFIYCDGFFFILVFCLVTKKIIAKMSWENSVCSSLVYLFIYF